MRWRFGVSSCLGCLALLLTANAFAQTKPLVAANRDDLAAGKGIFDAQCAWCHGASGTGGAGPSLQRVTLRHAANDTSLVDIVRNGIPGTEMPSFTTTLTVSSGKTYTILVGGRGGNGSGSGPGGGGVNGGASGGLDGADPLDLDVAGATRFGLPRVVDRPPRSPWHCRGLPAASGGGLASAFHNSFHKRHPPE